MKTTFIAVITIDHPPANEPCPETLSDEIAGFLTVYGAPSTVTAFKPMQTPFMRDCSELNHHLTMAQEERAGG